jgi:FdhD protein
LYREWEIVKWDGEACRPTVDRIVEEFPLTVVLDGWELATLLCSPDGLEDLVTGFLAAEGVIKSFEDLKALDIDMVRQTATVQTRDGFDSGAAERLLYKPTITSGCAGGSAANIRDLAGIPPVTGEAAIAAERLIGLMAQFQKRAVTFRETGGTHAAGLVIQEEIFAFYEDIGRHNAVDKVLGCGLRRSLELSCAIVLSSGRLSSEAVLKAARMRVPIVVSKSAPTVYAVEVAVRLGVTVVGFARGRRMNIYSLPHRIKCARTRILPSMWKYNVRAD